MLDGKYRRVVDDRDSLEGIFEARKERITFDDTFAVQYDFARPLLDGLPATFYVNSPRLGRPGYMTKAQLDDLVRAGHEIGSHTLHHLHL